MTKPERKRTAPTVEPQSGGSYDLETGEQLQAPPAEKVHPPREDSEKE